MESEFITYQKFNDPALAEELCEQLKNHNIPYEIEEQSLTFSITFVLNDPLQKEYAVKIKSDDFETVNKLLIADENVKIDELDKDYYLFKFTDSELLDVIAKADEWSPFDIVLAKKILSERGRNLDDATLTQINENRIEDLKKTEPSQLTWVIVGYLIALSGVVIINFFSAIGIFIGWYLSSYKKTLPNGERVYGYNKFDRLHGKIIVCLAVTVIVARFVSLFLV